MYAVADALSEADRRKQREAFFGSMLVPGLRRCWSSPAPVCNDEYAREIGLSASRRSGASDQAKTGYRPAYHVAGYRRQSAASADAREVRKLATGFRFATLSRRTELRWRHGRKRDHDRWPERPGQDHHGVARQGSPGRADRRALRSKVCHVGRFPQLEEQMLNMASAGYVGAKSPDRLDALVWALSELMLGPQHSFSSGPLRL